MTVRTFLMTLLLPLSVAQAATAPAQATDYQLNGWNLQVRLVPEKTSFVQGEPVYLAFTIRNNSTENLKVIVGGDTPNWLGRPEKFTVQVARANGSLIPLRVLSPGAPEGSSSFGPREIPAKGSYSFSLLLSDWAELREPGDYAITASRTLDLLKRNDSGSDLPWEHFTMLKDLSISWKDSPGIEHLATRASATITLAPYNRAALGTVIDAHGRAMLVESIYPAQQTAAEIAARALAQIDDERVVPYFRRVVVESTDWSKLLVAIRALARFNNDAALESLVLAARSPSDRTRHSAAISLSQSPHRGAADALMALRSDPHDAVRNVVLQAMAGMRTAESLEIIREMTNDAIEPLRADAQRYLKAREASVPTRGR